MRNLGLLGAIALGGLSVACSTEKQVTPPNVLFILTDDQGWGDFGFNGNKVVQTPTLDSLCKESAYFTNFYVSPLSASTRAGLLTGRDHLRTGAMFVTRSSENMHSNEQTLAEVFKSNGYTTGCFGKWHNGAHYPQDPNGQGFDEFVGFCAGHLTNYFDSRLQHNQEFFNAKGYITDVLTDSAIEFIDKQAQSKEPFFCYVPYNAPHAPYQAPDEYFDKYAAMDIEGDDMTPAVYAMCENLDDNIARLLSHIKDNGLDENTLIVFMTDNGPNDFRYNGNLRGKKGDMYEGGFKVPCMFYWKGKIGAVELPQTASYIDIAPTIIDLCGLDYKPQDRREIDGVSLKGLLTAEQSELDERYLFTHRSTTDLELHSYNGTVYNDSYKLIAFANDRYELYDKVNDPSEKNNIFETEPEIAQKMVAEYQNWLSGVRPEYERSISRTANIGLLDTSVELPTHEALMSGTTRYFTNIYGWAGDWMTDMSPEDSIHWDVIVGSEGDYQVTLQYSSTEEPYSIAVNGGTPQKLAEYSATMIESPDRSPRVEAYEKIWGEQPLGTIHLKEGNDKVTLQFDSNTAIKKGSLEVKGIVLKKI